MSRVIALLYHDVVTDEDLTASGFSGPDADHYKISPEVFAAHLRNICTSPLLSGPPAGGSQLGTRPPPLCLTFDDGGSSALHPTADLLEAVGLRGYFFIPTDSIGKAGFATPHDLSELLRRGHHLGVHSASHPIPISALPGPALRREWVQSRNVLEQILGAPVVAGSVPGGYTSPLVEETAHDAGLRLLFTSQPTTRPRWHQDMLVMGRYSVTRTTSPEHVLALAHARAGALTRQAAIWTIKGIAKRLGGKRWLDLRRRYFARRS